MTGTHPPTVDASSGGQVHVHPGKLSQGRRADRPSTRSRPESEPLHPLERSPSRSRTLLGIHHGSLPAPYNLTAHPRCCPADVDGRQRQRLAQVPEHPVEPVGEEDKPLRPASRRMVYPSPPPPHPGRSRRLSRRRGCRGTQQGRLDDHYRNVKIKRDTPGASQVRRSVVTDRGDTARHGRPDRRWHKQAPKWHAPEAVAGQRLETGDATAARDRPLRRRSRSSDAAGRGLTHPRRLAARACGWSGGLITVKAKGRLPKWCSQPCRHAPANSPGASVGPNTGSPAGRRSSLRRSDGVVGLGAATPPPCRHRADAARAARHRSRPPR